MIKRTLSLLTALIFASVNVLLAQPAAPLAMEPAASSISGIALSDLKLPESLGSIDLKISATGDDRPFIAVIQDAHAVIDAQNNIHEIIRYMQEHYGIELIALEGGTGKLDPTLFRTFPNEFVKKKVLDDYLKKGELTGAEMAAALNQAEGEYYGIEDWDLYEEHYISYLRATEQKGDLLKRLSGIRSDLDRQRAKNYSAELNEFHENILKYENENTYLLEFLKYIGSFEGAKQKFAQYPDLEKLYRSYDFEKDHEQDKGTIELSVRQMAESFKATYVKRMNIRQEMEFHRSYQAFVTGQMDAGQFLKILIDAGESFGVKAKLTPSMLKLLGHSETLATIKGTKLFEELQSLITEIQSELMTKKEERDLAGKYQRLRVLESLANLELTRSQWDDFEKDPASYLSLLGNREDVRHGIEFYRLALRRDQAFRENLKQLLKDQKAKAAIVIAGGFHTQGFEKSLKDEGFSFSVITPKIQSLSGHETYASVMQGNISYKPYLRTTFYDAFMRDSSIKMAKELSEPDFRRNIKLWRDEIVRKLSREKKLTRVREYTRYIDLVYKIYHEKFGQGNRSSQSQEKIVKAIEQELKEFSRDAIGRHREKLDWQVRQFSEGLEALIRQNDLGVQQVTALVNRVRAAEPATLNLFPNVPAMIPQTPPVSRMSPVIETLIRESKLVPETTGTSSPVAIEKGPLEIATPANVAEILRQADQSPEGAAGFLRNLGSAPAVRIGGADVAQGKLPQALIGSRSEVRGLDDKRIADSDMKSLRRKEHQRRIAGAETRKDLASSKPTKRDVRSTPVKPVISASEKAAEILAREKGKIPPLKPVRKPDSPAKPVKTITEPGPAGEATDLQAENVGKSVSESAHPVEEIGELRNQINRFLGFLDGVTKVIKGTTINDIKARKENIESILAPLKSDETLGASQLRAVHSELEGIEDGLERIHARLHEKAGDKKIDDILINNVELMSESMRVREAIVDIVPDLASQTVSLGEAPKKPVIDAEADAKVLLPKVQPPKTPPSSPGKAKPTVPVTPAAADLTGNQIDLFSVSYRKGKAFAMPIRPNQAVAERLKFREVQDEESEGTFPADDGIGLDSAIDAAARNLVTRVAAILKGPEVTVSEDAASGHATRSRRALPQIVQALNPAIQNLTTLLDQQTIALAVMKGKAVRETPDKFKTTAPEKDALEIRHTVRRYTERVLYAVNLLLGENKDFSVQWIRKNKEAVGLAAAVPGGVKNLRAIQKKAYEILDALHEEAKGKYENPPLRFPSPSHVLFDFKGFNKVNEMDTEIEDTTNDIIRSTSRTAARNERAQKLLEGIEGIVREPMPDRMQSGDKDVWIINEMMDELDGLLLAAKDESGTALGRRVNAEAAANLAARLRFAVLALNNALTEHIFTENGGRRISSSLLEDIALTDTPVPGTGSVEFRKSPNARKFAERAINARRILNRIYWDLSPRNPDKYSFANELAVARKAAYKAHILQQKQESAVTLKGFFKGILQFTGFILWMAATAAPIVLSALYGKGIVGILGVLVGPLLVSMTIGLFVKWVTSQTPSKRAETADDIDDAGDAGSVSRSEIRKSAQPVTPIAEETAAPEVRVSPSDLAFNISDERVSAIINELKNKPNVKAIADDLSRDFIAQLDAARERLEGNETHILKAVRDARDVVAQVFSENFESKVRLELGWAMDEGLLEATDIEAIIWRTRAVTVGEAVATLTEADLKLADTMRDIDDGAIDAFEKKLVDDLKALKAEASNLRMNIAIVEPQSENDRTYVELTLSLLKEFIDTAEVMHDRSQKPNRRLMNLGILVMPRRYDDYQKSVTEINDRYRNIEGKLPAWFVTNGLEVSRDLSSPFTLLRSKLDAMPERLKRPFIHAASELFIVLHNLNQDQPDRYQALLNDTTGEKLRNLTAQLGLANTFGMGKDGMITSSISGLIQDIKARAEIRKAA